MEQIMLDIKKESYIELKRVATNREEWKNIPSFNQSTDFLVFIISCNWSGVFSEILIYWFQDDSPQKIYVRIRFIYII